MNNFLSKLRNNSLRTNITYLTASFLALYVLSFAYVSYYWKEYQEEFESYHIYEVSMILFYRASMNLSFGLLVIPTAFGRYLLEGVFRGGNIIYTEVLDIPNILKKIFNSWFIRLLWDNIKYYMVLLGTLIEPYFTLLVKLSIYLGLLVTFALVVYGIVSAFTYIFTSNKTVSTITTRSSPRNRRRGGD